MHEVDEAPTKRLKADPGIVESKLDIPQSVGDLFRDGIVGLKGAFTREWAEQMKEDMMEAFWKGIQRPKGTLSRGPRRWYCEIHPEEFRGFVDLVTHPWVTGMCETVLGPEYQIVELAFDVPFEGARDQPWHRDFPSPSETYNGKKFMSLAFNLSGVDVTKEMGALEIAHGTQWDDGRGWKEEMFPPKEEWARYKAMSTRKYPQMGDISCRADSTIHHGTMHPSPIPRPVLVLGVDAKGAAHSELHAPTATQGFWDALPSSVKEHLICRVVDKLSPVEQIYECLGLTIPA